MNPIKPHLCLKCGKTFARKYDLGRHIEHVHTDDMSEEDESSQSEDERDEEDDEVESMDEDDLEDNPTYQEWHDQAKEATREMWNDKYEKYMNEGMSEELAKEKADMKTSWAVKRIFFNNYEDFLSHYINLKDDETHQEIEYDLEKKVKQGMDINKALKRVMPKHRAKFDGLFQYGEEENEEEEDSENDENNEQ